MADISYKKTNFWVCWNYYINICYFNATNNYTKETNMVQLVHINITCYSRINIKSHIINPGIIIIWDTFRWNAAI